MIDLERRHPAGDGRSPATEASASRSLRIAWSLSTCWAVSFVAAIALLLIPRPGDRGGVADLPFLLSTATFAIAAIAIMVRQPGNRIAWILMAIGIGWSVGSLLEYYGDLALARGLPGGAVAIALSAPLWAPPIVLMGTVLLLRFPDGELLSPRWRIVERVAVISTVLIVALIVVSPGGLSDSGYPGLANPLGIPALATFLDQATVIILVIPIAILASAVSLFLRFRRSRGVERLQLKWLVAAAVAVATAYFVAMIASLQTTWMTAQTPTWAYVTQVVALMSFTLIPIAIGIAILRYRLYEIDVVINKALVYGSLAVFITAAYVGIVVGIGKALGSPRNIGLSVLATAVVAIVFQPAKDRAQRFANRFVYGERAAPYDVLAHLSSRMSGTFETEDVLPRLATLLVGGTGAAKVEVWLRVGDQLQLEAAWPHDDETGARTLPLRDGEVPQIPAASAAIAVRDSGELLGALAMRKAPGDPVTPPERALAEDVARQAALLLRNARLVEELRASRERIVVAQDDERRRLERNIHDGIEKQLVALARATRAAETTLGPEAPPALRDLLERAIHESDQALGELRELARGIHPRILTEQGLPAAIRSLAARSPVPVTVSAEGDEALPDQIEATAYFAVSEALANVAKYARASRVIVTSAREDGAFVVQVKDDGVGGADPAKGTGLRGLVDRIDAVGGALNIESPEGRGTSLTLTLPVE